MDDRAEDGDQPGGGDVASEDAFRLASFEERDELRGHREVSAAQFLRREPGDVDRENAVELAELLPGREKHSFQRLLRLAASGLGPADCFRDQAGRVARTTPARRAISAMLASGSLASPSRAALMMEVVLRSASARRCFRADALACVFVLLIG